MSLLILSLLLILLVGIGMLMGRKTIHELFANPSAAPATVQVSPTLANLVVRTPKDDHPAQPNPLARDQEAVGAANAIATAPKCAACPACPSCPTCEKCPKCEDMSKYIRMDEVPCWNCTLP